MATYYSANQAPSTHDGFTQFISNDRGHLLPGVPRSKVNPWGTFIGTWDMPCKIPPAKVSLTSRSADASRRLMEWIEESESLVTASNGLRPDVTGKVFYKTEDDPQRQSPKNDRAPCSPQEKAPQRSASQPGSCNGGRSRHQEAPGDHVPSSCRRTSPHGDS
ncbi:protein Flattop isoform X2 [Rhinoderma darwinii]|uniref:protein Flattop isoform X2 n=1 Tax=Rhinoderma darwinii TaxID=43563 RepID=UPI003F6626C7